VTQTGHPIAGAASLNQHGVCQVLSAQPSGQSLAARAWAATYISSSDRDFTADFDDRIHRQPEILGQVCRVALHEREQCLRQSW